MKKVFIILQFGKPHEWTQQFIDHVQHLGALGWYFQIYTPNDFAPKGNVKIIPMTIQKFNVLCEEKLGIKPTIYITDKGIPSSHITDYLVALGSIFEDYLREFDYWGVIGLDCVVGRLDHFLPDELLSKYDIYSDDVNTINGNFCLWRNTKEITELFKKIEFWKDKLTPLPCPGCLGSGQHTLYGTDEYDLTKVVRVANIKFGYPKYYPDHGHDRLEIHLPRPKLSIEADGSLWELIQDVNRPNWEHGHDYFGHEISHFHFSQSKRWPL